MTHFQPCQLVQARGPDAFGADKPQAASKQIAAHVHCKGRFTAVGKKEKNTDEGKDGHDVSSGTLVNSSNLCLKRDPENKKYMRENQVFCKATASDVIMQRDNAAWER